MERKELKALLLAKTEGRCAYCGVGLDGSEWHIEHVNPLGGNGHQNLVASCPRCNLRKQRFQPDRFKEYLRENMKKRMFKNLDYLNEYCSYSPRDGKEIRAKWLDLIESIDNAELLFFFETLGGETPEYF